MFRWSIACAVNSEARGSDRQSEEYPASVLLEPELILNPRNGTYPADSVLHDLATFPLVPTGGQPIDEISRLFHDHPGVSGRHHFALSDNFEQSSRSRQPTIVIV